MIVTLDVKNAFSRMTRAHIVGALRERNLPGWQLKLLADYLQDRKLIYATRDGRTLVEGVHAGVPQGSVLGPILWNVGYDGVLGVPVPAEVELVGYADDLVILVVDRDQEALAEKATKAIDEIMRWMVAAGLELATHKTEALLLTGRKRKQPIRFRVGGDWVETGKTLTYLGVMIQGNLTFTTHVERVTSKAKRVASVLARITPNVGGAGFVARRCYYRVIEAILLYASPNWDRAFNFDLPRRKLRSAQRTALFSLVRAYRTVSWNALCVLAGIPPIDLVAVERRKAFQRRWPSEERGLRPAEKEPEPPRYVLRSGRTESGREERTSVEGTEPVRTGVPGEGTEDRAKDEAAARKEDRAATLKTWQEWWMTAETGQRTRDMIPNIEEWLDWGPRTLTFRLAQYITGHGCYAEYLHRVRKIETPACWHCPHPTDTACHTVVECPQWQEERGRYESRWGTINEHQLIRQLAGDLKRRCDFVELVESIMKKKEELHARREKELREIERDRNNI